MHRKFVDGTVADHDVSGIHFEGSEVPLNVSVVEILEIVHMHITFVISIKCCSVTKKMFS